MHHAVASSARRWWAWKGWPDAFALAVVLSLCGCNNQQPSASTGPSAATPAPATPAHVLGRTEDSAFRSLSGVKVDIVDGAQAGASAVTGNDGRFEFRGTLSGTVALRAARDGFATATQTFTWRPASETGLYGFALDPLESALRLTPGTYTVTLTNDRSTSRDGAAACAGFPDALLTRSYSATITSWPAHPTSQFSVDLQVNASAPNVSSVGFALGIAGDAVGFTIDGPAIGEALPNNAYLEISGSAPTGVPATSTSAGIAIPFSGSFEYCALKSPIGRQNNCFTTPMDQKSAYAQCLSDHDLMVLTRR
jgi:hypothetical protein